MSEYVSVVMPAYNASATIAQSIESVLQQTHAALELIVIDDCSTDDTRQIAEDYARRDHRVCVLHSEMNGGVSDARNRGVAAAQYEWIALLDSDDCWEPEKLAFQMDAVQKNPQCPLFFTGSAFVDENGCRSGYVLHVPQRVTKQELLCQNVISCSSVLVKREMLCRFPMYHDRRIHEDYAVWLRILQEIPYAVGIDRPLLIYRISASSKSGNKLRAAGMQWRTYRHIHLPMVKSCVCFVQYAVRNLRKYHGISKNM